MGSMIPKDLRESSKMRKVRIALPIATLIWCLGCGIWDATMDDLTGWIFCGVFVLLSLLNVRLILQNRTLDKKWAAEEEEWEKLFKRLGIEDPDVH